MLIEKKACIGKHLFCAELFSFYWSLYVILYDLYLNLIARFLFFNIEYWETEILHCVCTIFSFARSKRTNSVLTQLCCHETSEDRKNCNERKKDLLSSVSRIMFFFQRFCLRQLNLVAQLICALNHWKMKVGVALHFINLSP